MSNMGAGKVSKCLPRLRLIPGLRLPYGCAIAAFLRRRPYFVVPLYIEFRDTLPRNPTGKVL